MDNKYINLILNFGKPITRFFYYFYKIRNKFSEKINIPILCYHNISNSLSNDIYPPYYVHKDLFIKQMEYLNRNNYSVISLYDFLLFCAGEKAISKKSVILTFDDGYKNVYKLAYPILKAYQFPATIFLAVAFIDNSKPFPWLKFRQPLNENQTNDWLPLSWNEIIEMNTNLINFGSHSLNHLEFNKLSKDQTENEFRESKNMIEKKIRTSIDLFSFPFSSTNLGDQHRTKFLFEKLVEYCYIGACTTKIGTNNNSADPFFMSRFQINNTDSIQNFKAKVNGAYSWVRFPQLIYAMLQNYNVKVNV